MKRIKFLSLLLVLSTLISMLSISASASNNEPLISDQQILQAAQALIAAEAEYYNISNIAVQNVLEEPQEDGTTHVLCDLVFTMCLKAESVEELPYVAGLLEGINAGSVAECMEMTNLSAVANTSKEVINLDTEAVAAYQALDFISTVSENIGNTMELCFPLVLHVSSDGVITDVLGNSDYNTFPLSDYFPKTEAQMYQDGLSHAEEITIASEKIADEINVAQLIYYRVDARNYANRYTSNATSNYNGSTTQMNPNFYNKSYLYYVDADCANFVSQAIHYGGIATSATWNPQTYTWYNVLGLISHFRDTLGMIQESNFASCNAGGLIVSVERSTGIYKHVVMCVLNDTVNRAFSAHTHDRKQRSYTSSYPDRDGHYAIYFTFKLTSTETQYGTGLLNS